MAPRPTIQAAVESERAIAFDHSGGSPATMLGRQDAPPFVLTKALPKTESA
jgi:hypothetical protein